MCRKHHGAAFATHALVARDLVTIHDPNAAVSCYRSSDKVSRSFCRICGSSLFWSHDDAANWIDVALGTFDAEPERTPDAHIYVGSKAAWVHIDDDLPRYEAFIPRRAPKPTS
jgi:hypothetical protein